MPLDTSLQIAEEAGSALLHAVLPWAASPVLSYMTDAPLKQKLMVLIVVCTIASFLIQFGMLTVLQQVSCQGVQNFGGILKAATIAALLTAAMVWLPTTVDWVRLTVSERVMVHHPIQTPVQQAVSAVVEDAAVKVATLESAATQQAGGSRPITLADYEEQTLQETRWAMSYMAAFAGIFGIAIGGLHATDCPKAV
jgi:ABC-type multidrug transport system fused ATPase/permease subunit